MPIHRGALKTMRTTPRLLFGLALGLLIGLLYGWVIRPVEYVDTAPASMRADYRADFVLMIAEAYTQDTDLELARVRLASLGPKPPINFVVAAIDYGVQEAFPQTDLQTLNHLAVDLRSMPASAEIELP
jgi:hypothetical protein